MSHVSSYINSSIIYQAYISAVPSYIRHIYQQFHHISGIYIRHLYPYHRLITSIPSHIKTQTTSKIYVLRRLKQMHKTITVFHLSPLPSSSPSPSEYPPASRPLHQSCFAEISSHLCYRLAKQQQTCFPIYRASTLKEAWCSADTGMALSGCLGLFSFERPYVAGSFLLDAFV